ncbi:MAG: hypothetical protein RDV48_19045 [Candidatus Eremiobacteraeota bacterium]|nr:hypothetical protein [Candidatus Eremiobacteraeota bacterium]
MRRFFLSALCLVALLAISSQAALSAGASDTWKIDLQKGSYGPLQLGMPLDEAKTTVRKFFKDADIRPTGILCEIIARGAGWTVNMMFENGRAYDLMLSGSFPGSSPEGITYKSTQAEVMKKLGRPDKVKNDKDLGTTTLIYLKPNCRLTWSSMGSTTYFSLRFVPPGQRTAWD